MLFKWALEDIGRGLLIGLADEEKAKGNTQSCVNEHR